MEILNAVTLKVESVERGNKVNLLDYEEIQNFYNKHIDCWAVDLFSQMTTAFIDKYVYRVINRLDSKAVLLNAGSGGKQYETDIMQVHLDIAEKTLEGIENAYVGNIIDMPFQNNTFDCIICVGTVINYCEAEKALKEMARVSKNDAILILEYERSGSGLVMHEFRNKDRIVFCHTYFNEPHSNFLYSDSYIRELLTQNGFMIKQTKRFNTTIPVMEMFVSEKVAHRLTVLEPILRIAPFINLYSHNEILLCKLQKKCT